MMRLTFVFPSHQYMFVKSGITRREMLKISRNLFWHKFFYLFETYLKQSLFRSNQRHQYLFSISGSNLGCFLKTFYCIIYDTAWSKSIFTLIQKREKIKKNLFDAKNLMNVDQLKLYKTKLSQYYEYIEAISLNFTVMQWTVFYIFIILTWYLLFLSDILTKRMCI